MTPLDPPAMPDPDPREERPLPEEEVASGGEPAAEGPADAPVEGDDVVAQAEAVLDEDLAAVANDRDAWLERAQRIQADFENYKKQMLRRQTDVVERAAEDLVVKLLPVLDTADLAVAHDGSESLLQLASSLYEVLHKEGMERIDPAGEAFDPTEHDAVLHEEGDGDPRVVEVLRAGFKWRGRVLRPAMVKVKG